MSENSECRGARERLHEYLDGELQETAQVECEQHVTQCDECKSILVEYRSVKSAVGAKAARHQAPAYLAVRVRERIESSARPHFWENIKAVYSRRPVAVGIAFVLVVLILWIVPNDRSGYVVAEEVTRDCFEGHGLCTQSALMSQHVFTNDPAALSRILTVRTKHEVWVPDLSEVGCRLVEGHICSVRGVPAVHIYYDNAEGERISLFRIPGIEEKGALGEKVELGVEAYIPPLECWRNQEKIGMHVLIWRSDSDCVSLLLGHEPQTKIEDMVRSCSAPHPPEGL